MMACVEDIKLKYTPRNVNHTDWPINYAYTIANEELVTKEKYLLLDVLYCQSTIKYHFRNTRFVNNRINYLNNTFCILLLLQNLDNFKIRL